MGMKQFGGKITPSLRKRYAKSPNWNGKKFENLEETSMSISWDNIPELLRKQFFDKQDREPNKPIPILPFNKEIFLSPSQGAKFIWYGHAVVLLRIAGKTILIDPMLGPNASPIAPFATKRFSENTLNLIDEFPDIDYVLFTHDHYDHLDLASINKLKKKVKQFVVALGVGRHLKKWDIPFEQITEMDWWDSLMLGDIKLTFTPTRHFSGRGLTDREKSLWGGWVFKTDNENIYFSGDGGYGKHFTEIGNRLGPFDFAFMECGQYNENWRPIHLFPDESIQAAIDVGAKHIMPFHWASFALAQHTWMEPAADFARFAEEKNFPYSIPQLGELVHIHNPIQGKEWWADKY